MGSAEGRQISTYDSSVCRKKVVVAGVEQQIVLQLIFLKMDI
jgi:hypothetical protein